MMVILYMVLMQQIDWLTPKMQKMVMVSRHNFGSVDEVENLDEGI